MAMNRDRFERLVAKAVEDLPDKFAAQLDNVAIVVQDYPTAGQARKAGLRRDETLLGLYEGVPQTKRGTHYGMVTPDKITIFRRPIEALGKDNNCIINEIEKVIKHEIAHHFGITDTRLRQLEEVDD
jgi:predicted Zn-dependent protease with MMP-like domain